jgi:hypothetical protein
MRHRVRSAAVLLVLALLVPACGLGADEPRPGPAARTADKPARDILADAQAAFRSARSVRVTGRIARGTATDPIELDMRIARGVGARGQIVSDGVRVNLIRSGGRLWLRGRRFWQQAIGEEVARDIGDRWVLVPPSAAAGAGPGIDAFSDLDGILEQLLTPEGDVAKGATQPIRGVPAIGLTGGSGTLWVAAEGRPYPLRVAGRGPDQFIDFVEYDAPVSITAPAGAIEDPATLG